VTLTVVTEQTANFEGAFRREKTRLTKDHGYRVCGHIVGWRDRDSPVLCAMPLDHLGKHRASQR